MATKKVTKPAETDPQLSIQKLKKLSVKNFRCVGNVPVVIELDQIVVLVGPNNTGKSSILRAYELVMSEGSAKAKLTREDFPEGKLAADRYPEIELETIVGGSAPGSKWIATDTDGNSVVRERWIWRAEGPPQRQGYDTTVGDWSDDNVPWGAPNVAQFGRPEPHRVDAFADPKIQADEIVGLLKSVLQQRLLTYTAADAGAGSTSDYEELLRKIAAAQKKIVAEAAQEIQKVEGELSSLIGAIFPNHVVRFDAKPEEDLDKSVQFFKSDATLLMGPADGYQSSVAVQGSGARRALLWTALKILAAASKPKGKTAKTETAAPGRSHVLLIDEPEICLHPSAIREACKLLYDLPTAANWQVMATTHSPAFIDISRDNTTIVRVDRQSDGQVVGTTVFRPDRVKLDADDRARLKLLNIYDPYVGEFFFGGPNVIVEGDTEYTALRHLVANDSTLRRDVHIIRARGKATIVSLMKILNQFGSSYAVLHDSDRPTRKDGKANSAWTLNERIREAANAAPAAAKVRVLAAVPNFDEAFFGKAVDDEKPYNAIEQLESRAEVQARIKALFVALTDLGASPPAGCLEWKSLADLEKAISAA